MKIDLEKLKVSAVICANEKCPNYDAKAVMYLYPSSVYCSLGCKYSDTNPSHKETYGD
jgi:hypothetical protein